MFQCNVGCCCCFFFSFSFNQYLNLKFDCATTKAISCCPTHESCICFKIMKGKKCRRNKWFKFMCHTHRPRWCRWWCWISSGVLLCSKWIWVTLQTHIYNIHNRCVHSFIAVWNNWSMNICVCLCVCERMAKHRQTNFIHQNFRISAKKNSNQISWLCTQMSVSVYGSLSFACVCARWATVEVAHTKY